MLTSNEEKKLLKKVIFTPIIFIIASSLIVLFILIGSAIKQNNQESAKIQKLLTDKIKVHMKNRTEYIYKKINYQKNISERLLKESLKEKLDIAYKVIEGIYKNNLNIKKERVIKLIKDALRSIRYNHGRGYFFIYDLNCTNILLPISPKYEGKDFSKYVDSEGDRVVKNMTTILKKQDKTFYTWHYIEPNKGKKYYKKIGFNKIFKPLGIFVGTGEYLGEFEKNIKKSIILEIIKTYQNDDISLSIINKNGFDFINGSQKTLRVKSYGVFSTFDDSIFYAKYVRDWGWSIVTAYSKKKLLNKIQNIRKNMHKELRKTIIKILIVYIIFILILSLLLTTYSKKIKKNFINYKMALKREEELLLEKERLISENQKYKEIRDILSYIAHQWRQPLNALSMQINKLIMLRGNDVLTKKEEMKNFKEIEKKIVYLSKTIDIFKDFFKHSPDEKTYFSLLKATKEVVFIVAEECKQNSIKLIYNIQNDIKIYGNKKEFQQALINLINNSKEHIIQNNIQNGFIKIEAKTLKQKTLITIEDNAGGITCKIDHKKIFEPYFTTKKSYGNSGLGLYISKNIIGKHFKGQISLKNSSNGAIFIISTPNDA